MTGIMEYGSELGSAEAHRALEITHLENAMRDEMAIIYDPKYSNSKELVDAAQKRYDAYKARLGILLKGLPEDSQDPNGQIPENELH